MAIPKPQPPDLQPNPYTPPGPEPLIFEDFQGIDTQATRMGVDEKQMYWCSGFFPIAPRNLRTHYGIGPILWTSPGAEIVFYGFANIGATPIAIVFLVDGSIWQINTITGTATNIAGTGTIVSPSPTTTGLSQWGSTYVLIINKQTNGYFVWDGTLLYQAGTLAPIVTLTNAGSGYTSAPTITASGGHGSGATFTAQINTTGAVTSVTVTNDTGPNFNRLEQIAAGPVSATIFFSGGGGSGAAGTVNLQQIGSGSFGRLYQVSSITITNGGTGYGSAPTVTLSVNNLAINGGPDNLGPPILTAVVGTSSPVIGVTITNPGTGYQVGDTVTLAFSGGGGSSAAATVTLMPFGIGGTDVETYAGRVWLINGAVLQFSAPGSVTNFATSAGGGSVTSNDSFLRVGYTRVIQTNGFLYLIADSSMNYISGVQTSGSPPTTTYTNQNADPEVGTPYPLSAIVFGRNIVLANSVGVHVMYGAAATKVSTPLDGVYNTVTNFNGLQLSAAKATIFGKKVFMVLVPVIDPVTGLLSNELFLSDDKLKKWWSSKQDVAPTFIAAQEINSVLTAWGTDGGRLFQLFNQPSTAFTKTAQSKLWTTPGGYQFVKTPVRFFGLAQYYGTQNQNVALTIDSELTSQPYTLSPPAPTVTWYNSSNQVATWTNSTPAMATWSTATTGIRVYSPQAIGQQGVTTGMTLSTTCNDMAFVSTMMIDNVVTYRG